MSGLRACAWEGRSEAWAPGRGAAPSRLQVRKSAGESSAPPGRAEEIAPCMGNYVRRG